MDPGVALVQAYLQLSGYLTVSEFPVVGRGANGSEVLTDIDLIALRFPLARAVGDSGERSSAPDEALQVGEDAMDLLICEVKEGKARVNPNLRRADTLGLTLRRVGCCPPGDVEHHVRHLLQDGRADMAHPSGIRCRARVALFAGRPGRDGAAALVIPLAHVAHAIGRFLDEHREALHAAHLTQPALAHLQLLDKLGLFPDQAAGRRASRPFGTGEEPA